MIGSNLVSEGLINGSFTPNSPGFSESGNLPSPLVQLPYLKANDREIW